jgi:hypothetical protein
LVLFPFIFFFSTSSVNLCIPSPPLSIPFHYSFSCSFKSSPLFFLTGCTTCHDDDVKNKEMLEKQGDVKNKEMLEKQGGALRVFEGQALQGDSLSLEAKTKE